MFLPTNSKQSTLIPEVEVEEGTETVTEENETGFNKDPVQLDLHSFPGQLRKSSLTGRIHGTLCSTFPSNNGLISYSLVADGGDICLYAKRGPWCSNVKFSIFNRNMKAVGYLSQIQSSFSCHAYVLAIEAGSTGIAESAPVAFILYQVPSISAYVTKQPPRRAQVALQLYAGVDNITTLSGFQDVCLSTIVRNGRLPAKFPPGVAATVLESKEPYAKANGRWGLDFAGRGRGSSPQNMQLSEPAADGDDGSGPVVLQMCKWETHPKRFASSHKLYHVDFTAPCTPFQAFGFALAQLGL